MFAHINRLFGKNHETHTEVSATSTVEELLSQGFNKLQQQELRPVAEYEEALQKFNQALTEQANNQEALVARGAIYMKQSKAREAQRDFARAMSNTSLSQQQALTCGYGECLRLLKCYEDALRAFESIKVTYPQDQEAYPKNTLILSRIGSLLISLRRLDEAKSYLDKAVALCESENELSASIYGLALASRANYHRMKGNEEAARTDLAKIKETTQKHIRQHVAGKQLATPSPSSASSGGSGFVAPLSTPTSSKEAVVPQATLEHIRSLLKAKDSGIEAGGAGAPAPAPDTSATRPPRPKPPIVASAEARAISGGEASGSTTAKALTASATTGVLFSPKGRIRKPQPPLPNLAQSLPEAAAAPTQATAVEPHTTQEKSTVEAAASATRVQQRISAMNQCVHDEVRVPAGRAAPTASSPAPSLTVSKPVAGVPQPQPSPTPRPVVATASRVSPVAAGSVKTNIKPQANATLFSATANVGTPASAPAPRQTAARFTGGSIGIAQRLLAQSKSAEKPAEHSSKP